MSNEVARELSARKKAAKFDEDLFHTWTNLSRPRRANRFGIKRFNETMGKERTVAENWELMRGPWRHSFTNKAKRINPEGHRGASPERRYGSIRRMPQPPINSRRSRILKAIEENAREAYQPRRKTRTRSRRGAIAGITPAQAKVIEEAIAEQAFLEAAAADLAAAPSVANLMKKYSVKNRNGKNEK
jgi:hypothetical protein